MNLCVTSPLRWKSCSDLDKWVTREGCRVARAPLLNLIRTHCEGEIFGGKSNNPQIFLKFMQEG